MCPSLEGVSPVHHKNILFAPGVGIGGGWQGTNPTPTTCSVKGTLPQPVSLVRGIPHSVLSWAV